MNERETLMRQLFLTLAEAMGARENVRAIHLATRGEQFRVHEVRAYDRQYRYRRAQEAR